GGVSRRLSHLSLALLPRSHTALAANAVCRPAHVWARWQAVLDQQFLQAADAMLAVDLLGVPEDRSLAQADVGGDVLDHPAGEEALLDLEAAAAGRRGGLGGVAVLPQGLEPRRARHLVAV